jgi:hypothetical protein
MQRAHSSRGHWDRRALGGVLFIGALLAGCAAEEPQPTALGAQVQRAAAAVTAAPRLASITATPQETVSSRTRTLVEATLASGQAQVSQVTVDGDDGKAAVLRDDGTGGDAKAADGVFSGLATVDIKAEADHNNSIADFSSRFGDQLVDATFDGRELVRQVPLRPQSVDLFKPLSRIPLRPMGISFAIDPARSLIIRHTSVINDPTRTFDPCTGAGNPAGVWTFNHLMTEMANQPLTGITPSDFTRRWLRHWEVNQTINFWNVAARPAILPKITTPWPTIAGLLDMNRSPFKLVAIVNRLDLGQGTAPSGYGGSGAGELRFVFAAVDRSGGGCSVGRFLVIFEYGVPKTRCLDVKSWAQQWANLSLIALGTAAFNPALQALTEQVVVRNAAPAKPNGSAINQVRTNEIMLAAPWELREFHIFAAGAAPNHLVEHTMALTPGDLRNGSADLTTFINTNTPAILANTYTVPLTWAGNNFLGGNSQVPNPLTTFWNSGGITNLVARFKFSQNTCNGCHAREMNTTFTHISETGVLSPFLSGPLNVSDPVTAVVRSFNEILRRQNNLSSVASQSCLVRAFDLPAALTH